MSAETETAKAEGWEVQPARRQEALGKEPFDRWITPEGECKAEFYRTSIGYLVRFIDDVDFEIDATDLSVRGWPVPDSKPEQVQHLFENSVGALIGNHTGGLFLHGSAVSVDGQAIAFLGHGRAGKTTLAAFFARAGYPILTEDMIELKLEGGHYWLQPKHSALRLFIDSAEELLDRPLEYADEEEKEPLSAEDAVPFAQEAAALSHVFVLGSDRSAPLALPPLGEAEAVGELLPHAFILDVEDKPRLKSHFGRLAALSQAVRCHALDYTREYAELPKVIEAVLELSSGSDGTHE